MTLPIRGPQQSSVLDVAGIRLFCELAASECTRSRSKVNLIIAPSTPFFHARVRLSRGMGGLPWKKIVHTTYSG